MSKPYFIVEGRTYGCKWCHVSRHKTLRAAKDAAYRESRRGTRPPYPSWPARIIRCEILKEYP